MPWRLIGIIVVLVLLLGFIGLNLENTCSLNLGFTTFYWVPVYVTVLASFVLGMLFSLPFFIFLILKKKQKEENLQKSGQAEKNVFGKKSSKTQTKGPYGAD